MRMWPGRTWRMPTREKILYLTFDDGPTPEITPWVLDQLDAWQAKATFFCIGKNAQAEPEILKATAAKGHAIGNHTQNHLNGWKTKTATYLENVAVGEESLQTVLGAETKLFRPPYGKAGRRAARALQKRYQLIMWDVMSADFVQGASAEAVTQNVLKNARPGSIIVFHDSVKCREKMEYALPRVLEHFSQRGYRFEAIS